MRTPENLHLLELVSIQTVFSVQLVMEHLNVAVPSLDCVSLKELPRLPMGPLRVETSFQVCDKAITVHVSGPVGLLQRLSTNKRWAPSFPRPSWRLDSNLGPEY